LALYTSLPSAQKPLQFYRSSERNDLNRVLTQSIKKAHRTITLKTYALTDLSLLSLLKKRAREGIVVDLYYDEKASPLLTQLEGEYFHLHPQKGKGLFHEKIWIFDEEKVFLGSTNLTPSSLRMHENMMVGLFAPKLAKALSEGRPPMFQEEGLTYYSLPQSEAFGALLKTLRGAQKRVSLTLFTFTHPEIAEVLRELHQKGVKISLKLDGTSARGSSQKVKEFLNNVGIHVEVTQGLELCHEKVGVIDQEVYIIGSANWTKAAFQKNKDFILIINNLL
jgi:phosphatidylserine/phosphatidylglycerophosphate/cardiolipin synthase-like enzyme